MKRADIFGNSSQTFPPPFTVLNIIFEVFHDKLFNIHILHIDKHHCYLLYLLQFYSDTDRNKHMPFLLKADLHH